MIDERTLTDAARCPSCAGHVLGSTTCRSCGVDLTGPTARALWDVSVQSAGLLAERARLIGVLRVEAKPATPAIAMPARLPTLEQQTHRAAGASESTKRSAPEWTRRKVQNLLLSLGVGLLAVAAVIFLAVSWSVLGIGGRATVMVGCTVLAAGAAAFAWRRGLGSTAEAVSLLTVVLGLLDAHGARSAGLAGLASVDTLSYWAGALTVVAVLAAATAVVVPTRALRVAAAALGQLPIPLVTAHLAENGAHPAAVSAAGLTLAALLAAGLALAWPFGVRARDARRVVAGGAGLAWLLAGAPALVSAYGEPGSLVAGLALLLVLAGLAAGVPLLGDRWRPLATAGPTASAGLVVAAAWAVPVDQVEGAWLPVVLSAVAVGLLLASVVVPRAHRAAPAVVALLAAAGPGLVAALPVAAVVAGQVDWLERPWQGAAHASARELLTLADWSVRFTWGAEIPVLLACVAVAVVVADRVHLMRPAALAAVPLAALAASLLPIALAAPFGFTLGLDLLVAGALVIPGAWLLGRGQRGWGAVGAATGLVLLTLAVSWSLSVQSATLAALPVGGVLLAGAAWVIGGGRSVAPLRLGLGVGSALVMIAEAAALARADGAGWPAVWSLALGPGAVAAGAAAALLPGVVRRGFVVAAIAAVLGEAAALTGWADGSVASAGLAVTCTAGVLATGAIWLDTLLDTLGRTPEAPTRLDLLRHDAATTAGLGVVVGVAFSGLDVDRLWLALMAAGVAAAVVSARSGLHQVGWAAGFLLMASSWVRLALSHVDAPEPYTVPAGLALVVLGLFRRRREPACSSWTAYGTGLGLALGPSLVRALSDAGNLRPMLLGLAAVLVLGSGLARRLKAPLLVGATVLAVDGAVQLSPYLVAFYAAVPRWSVIAVTGLLLLTAGMTYERRAQQLQTLHHQISLFD
jgi:hypothetical protein